MLHFRNLVLVAANYKTNSTQILRVPPDTFLEMFNSSGTIMYTLTLRMKLVSNILLLLFYIITVPKPVLLILVKSTSKVHIFI